MTQSVLTNTTWMDNTNLSNLELYSIMGEYNNTGFPLTYCLLSTAEALEIGKWKKALNAWVSILCDKYGIIPVFTHTDKDMAEISMLHDVWILVNVQLCWWHLQKAVWDWLSKNKLSTTPYNVKCAWLEFAFIDIMFVPPGHADAHEYKGGMCDIITDIDKEPPCPSPNTISILIKPPPKPHNLWPWMVSSNTKPPGGVKADRAAPNTEYPDVGNEDDGKHRVFCPEEHCEPIVNVIEAYLCAHPLIPGYSHLSPEGIKEWAVKQMYQFCIKEKIPETWAYLWQNWYRKGCWELWVHSCHVEIPILKTTMMLESQ